MPAVQHANHCSTVTRAIIQVSTCSVLSSVYHQLEARRENGGAGSVVGGPPVVLVSSRREGGRVRGFTGARRLPPWAASPDDVTPTNENQPPIGFGLPPPPPPPAGSSGAEPVSADVHSAAVDAQLASVHQHNTATTVRYSEL